MPPAVRRYLESLLLAGRQPAFAFIGPDGTLESSGGEMDRYMKVPPHKGAIASTTFEFLEGLLPLDGEESLCVPSLIIGEHRTADLHLVADAGGVWVILLDSSTETERQQAFQQQSYDLQLLKARQLLMLAQLRSQNAHLEAILNQLRVAAVRIAPDGTVAFVNAFGQGLIGTGIPRAGRHWRELLPLADAEAEAFGALLASPPPAGGGLRARLTLERDGIPLHLETDVRADPQDSTFRIAYLYDISELQQLRSRLHEKAEFENMIGKSQPMQDIFQLIRDVARVNATVLIEGETGTGKELVARAIHFCSPRKDGPFVVVNCAGFTDSLINSQLFGHKKGSFTDAVSNQKGVFEAADGGTILLDEIGDIPMNTQTRILRALEQREIIRVGETEARKVDIRILAATNKNLEEEVRRGNFRLDLLYRIRVARVLLPALRERREDIPLLARAFAASVATENGIETPVIGAEVLATLMDYRWPGNVRELRNAVEFGIIRCRDGMLRVADLPPEILGTAGNASAPEVQPPAAKVQLLDALRAAGGRRADAAQRLNISRATLFRRMRQYGIQETEFT
jgi:DNA-binding NtrC family response regulator